jgi:NAD-dependent histone deacetylase SIR2
MSYLNHRNLLHIIYTQNIDGLELKAKVMKEKIIFAHGNTASAHCPGCKKENDIDKLKDYIEKGEILFCECNNPIKYNVILYGENLPKEVFTNLDVINFKLEFIFFRFSFHYGYFSKSSTF